MNPKTEQIMKTCSHSGGQMLIVTAVCLFFCTYDAASQAMASHTRRHHAAAARHAFGGGRLIVSRIPNLGNNVVVDMWLDGVPLEPIAYGHPAYEGPLPLGRHILSVMATPRPTWPGIRTRVVLDVRNGQTYRFIATGDHCGHLILRPVPGFTDGYTGSNAQYGK
jgi:hypothetical protein